MANPICKSLLILLVVYVSAVTGKEPDVAVVYPDVDEPESAIYSEMIKGIKTINQNVELIAFDKSVTNRLPELDKINPERIIAIGPRALEIVHLSSLNKLIMVSLVYFKPGQYVGVSLAIESNLMVEKLSTLIPGLERILVFQDSNHPTIHLLPDTENSRIKIEVREGNGQLPTIRLLGQFLEKEVNRTDAVVLPTNLSIDLLFEVAKVAWDKKIILVAPNLTDLENGALLAFYPDLFAMGQRLGILAKEGKSVSIGQESVRMALNRRIAQHLNLEMDESTLRLFKVIIN